MNTQPTSNIIRLDSAADIRITEKLPLIALSHEELRQLLVTQLQTTLDIQTILAMFFKSSQRLLAYDSLTYQHRTHDISIELGHTAKHSVSYNLNYQDDYLGNLLFTRNRCFTDKELADLEAILSSLVFPLRNGLLYSVALQNALKDPLTGAGNRIAMQQALQRDISTAQRHKQDLSILMLDIDYFKHINDAYGHGCGDTVLIEVVQHIQKQLRTTDALFRYGGEEFLILLPNTCGQDAVLVAERLRHCLEQMQLSVDDKLLAITASIGCVTLRSEDSQDSLLQRADTVLYTAKHNGRNQV